MGCARANALELAIDGEMDGRATLGIWQISIYQHNTYPRFGARIPQGRRLDHQRKSPADPFLEDNLDKASREEARGYVGVCAG
jgi:hypothetical protein